MDQEFKAITSQTEVSDEVAPPEFENMMDVVAHYWPLFYPGSIYVKGLLISECVWPYGRNLKHISDGAEWDVLGMMESVKMSIQAENVDDMVNGGGFIITPTEDDEEENGDAE